MAKIDFIKFLGGDILEAIASNIRLGFDERGQAEITLTIPNKGKVKANIDDLKDVVTNGKQLDVEIKQHRDKRSLDANSYCWVLIGKMADALLTDKDAIYIDMLKKYGQREEESFLIIDNERAIEMIQQATENHCTCIGRREQNGTEYLECLVLKGSSKYNTKEMSILIDGIVSEAQSMGIDTKTPDEISLMKSNWQTQTKQ